MATKKELEQRIAALEARVASLEATAPYRWIPVWTDTVTGMPPTVTVWHGASDDIRSSA